MKMRNGFVSNSSSSSFVILCREASIDDIDNPDFRILDGYGSDGEFYFKPTDEQIAYLKQNPNSIPHCVVEYDHICEDRTQSKDDFVQSINEIINKMSSQSQVHIKTCEVNYYSPTTLNDFINEYGRIK